MDKLNRVHSRAIIMYILFPCLAVLTTIICARIFHVLIPFCLFGSIALLGPLVSAIMRFHLWKNRYELLPDDVLNSRQARIVFTAIPVELIFWAIGMGFLMSEK